MSAEMLSFHGRFKDPLREYDEIKDVLIEGFEDIGLEPETDDEWDDVFELKDGYLEMSVRNCFGNGYFALEFIENNFIKEYPNVKVEMSYELYYPDCAEGEKITYDGKTIVRTKNNISYEKECIDYNVECPECGGQLTFCEDDFYCFDCKNAFSLNQMGIIGEFETIESLTERFRKEMTDYRVVV